MNQVLKSIGTTKDDEVFINNVEFKVPINNKKSSNNLNIRDSIAMIFSSMKQIDQTIAILPLKTDAFQPILSGASLPEEDDCFGKYFTIPIVDARHAKVYLYIQMTQGLNDIKFNPFIHAKLCKGKYWMNIHDLATFIWQLRVHCQTLLSVSSGRTGAS